MNKTRSKVMTIANHLVKQGLARSMATLKAWVIVKAKALRTKVRGTSYRQNVLEKLAGINPADISVKLKREPRNSHDSNAVAVYAALKDNRVFFYRLSSESRSERPRAAYGQGQRTEHKGVQGNRRVQSVCELRRGSGYCRIRKALTYPASMLFFTRKLCVPNLCGICKKC